MDALTMCPAMAQAAISEGNQLLVKIAPRSLLEKVMYELGSKNPPSVIVYKCPVEAVKVIIRLDILGARFANGYSSNVIDIEGDICPTRIQAEHNAVSKALSYLANQQNIKIFDYSSLAKSKLHELNVAGLVTSSIFMLHKLVDRWEHVLEKFVSAGVQLEGKHTATRLVEGNEQCDVVYYDLKEFIEETDRIFKKGLEHARKKASELDCNRKNNLSISAVHYMGPVQKEYIDVVVSAKYVLSYLLTFIGGGKPEYTNGPIGSRMMKAHVTFDFPEIAGVDLCGKIKIKGCASKSKQAEETAAMEALSYLEKRCNIRIVDYNYGDRLCTENELKSMFHVIGQVIKAANMVRRHWGELVERIKTKISDYPVNTNELIASSKVSNKDEAYLFCAGCLDELEHETETGYAKCSKLFEEVSSLCYKVHGMKDDIEMD